MGNWYYTQTPTPHLNKAYFHPSISELCLFLELLFVSQALIITPGVGFLAMASYVPEEEEVLAELDSDWASQQFKESFEGDQNLNGSEDDSLLE